MYPDPTPRDPSRPPFVVEHRHVPTNDRGTRFQPEARLFVSETLRTSGLLASLPDREAKNILWLLTYLHPNGHLFAPVTLLARDMGLSEREVRKQFLVLATTYWKEAPLVRHLSESSMERFLLSEHVLGEETLETSVSLPVPDQVSPPGHREAIIQMSREKYARPRAEVERMVLEQLGHHPEESAETPEGETRRGLRNVGVSREQIDLLIEEFGIEACHRQVQWLPLRGAKNPGRYVVAAIQDNYSPPRGARLPEIELSTEMEIAALETAPPVEEVAEDNLNVPLEGEITEPESDPSGLSYEPSAVQSEYFAPSDEGGIDD